MTALLVLVGLATDPAWPILDQAFRHLREQKYDSAITLFREAATLAPSRPDIWKNLGYTLLKVGETLAARDSFAQAMRLDPADHHVALEYAFLAHETGQTREARLVFERIRVTGNATAEQAFQNIDRPLAEGIARWQEALAREPDNFSAHHELARLGEQRNDWALAARHYEHAWRLKPGERTLLVDLGRVWKELGLAGKSMAALVAASRGPQPRAAETARALLPSRYPFVYEFRAAMALDPNNVELRRELAYLLLEMGDRAAAESEFQSIVKETPDDLLSGAQLGFLYLHRKEYAAAQPLLDRVLKSESAEPELVDRVRSVLGLPQSLRRRPDTPQQKDALAEAKTLAEKSYNSGYLKDALKYLAVLHESDPLDFQVALKLGYTHNLLKQDRQASPWFEMARHSTDPSIAAEAQRAYTNLRPGLQRVRTTAWMLPFYSSRWKDAFTYGQVKTEFRLARLGLRPYASLRFVGDTRGMVHQPYPQYLSENAFIAGGGVASPVHKGLMAWAEAGMAVSWRHQQTQQTAQPDYRGGLSFTRAWGRLIGSETRGPFVENHEDAVFVSRFNKSLLVYTQNKAGYTPAPGLQLYWNFNLTADPKRQYWANFVETGPGLRFRFAAMPPAMVFSVDWLRGTHTVNTGNPRGPGYFDLRVGVWCAFTR